MIEVRPLSNASTYGFLTHVPNVGDEVRILNRKPLYRVVRITHFPAPYEYPPKPENASVVVWVTALKGKRGQ